MSIRRILTILVIAAAAFGQNLLLRDCDVEDSCDVE